MTKPPKPIPMAKELENFLRYVKEEAQWLATKVHKMDFLETDEQEMADSIDEIACAAEDADNLAFKLWQDKEDFEEQQAFIANYNERDYFDERDLFNPADLK